MSIDLVNGIALSQCKSQQFVSQYVDDAPSTVRAKEASVDNWVVVCQVLG